MAQSDLRPSKWVGLTVWLFRLIVGATFIISGWSKSIDPWGFIYKIEEYFNVWGLIVPREMNTALAVIVPLCEFVTGVLIAVGAMRRASVWLSAAFMCVMLPLTAYIAVADPVSDCGCFGDFIVLSNAATLGKNIVLSAMIIYLMMRNDLVKGLYITGTQWLVATGAIIYSGCLAFFGYRYQPLVDFRPYPVGSSLVYNDEEDAMTEDDGLYIYEKNGREQSFTIDQIPDSTWTFVRTEVEPEADEASMLTVTDGDDDITDQVLDGVGEELILAVIDPGLHYLTKARLANELARYVEARNGRMLAFVAAEDEGLEAWRQLALPEYPVYSVEDTSLKELVRGDAGLIYVLNGKIMWKLNFASVSHDAIHGSDNDFVSVQSRIDGRSFHMWLTLGLAVWMIIVYLLNFPHKILSGYLRPRSPKIS